MTQPNKTSFSLTKASFISSVRIPSRVTVNACEFFSRRNRLRHTLLLGSSLRTVIDFRCRFKDAVATIRRTSTEFHYQLVIQRAYEEGEEQLVDDAEDVGDAKDEKTFLLDESLHLRSTFREGQAVFAWRDLSGVSRD